jgi:1,4-dihydroxy-2-naphthoyl-CoA hydrolase
MKEIFSQKNSPTLVDSLGIEFITLRKEEVVAKMPVDHRTRQIEGILHGGASAALIETIASVGSYLNIDPETQIAVGTELNVSHLSSAKESLVFGRGTPIRIGKTMHVWMVEIRQDQRIISTGRCSLYIMKRS